MKNFIILIALVIVIALGFYIFYKQESFESNVMSQVFYGEEQPYIFEEDNGEKEDFIIRRGPGWGWRRRWWGWPGWGWRRRWYNPYWY